MSANPSESRFSFSANDIQRLLTQARAGDPEALGRLLEATRDYLRKIAGRSLESDLRNKLSGSDLVQDTFVAAQKGFADFRGTTSEELLAWLRRILINKLLNCYREYRQTEKRNVSRERPYDSGAEPAGAGSETPSEVVARREEENLLESALQRLSHEHRQVIVLRHRDGMAFAEIGRAMNRSTDAARMLWYRAFDQLSAEVDGRD